MPHEHPAQAREGYEFGPFRLHPAEHLLLRGNKPVPLAPEAFRILVMLVEQSGRLVRNGDLMKKVWPDSFLEEANLTVTISALRRALGRRADGEEFISIVPRFGYRFNAAVRELEAGEQGQFAGGGSWGRAGGLGSRCLRGGVIAAAVLLALVVILGILWWRRRSPPAALSAPRSIAVLPFRSLGSSPDQEYLGLGLPDALITRLGSLPQIVVRPTASVRAYTAGGVDALAAGRQLKVTSVLDGTVQRSGDRIRVTVRLLSVPDGAQLWSDTFDEKFTDMFAVEDSVAQKVAEALSLELSAEDQQRLSKRYTGNSDAYQLYLKGRYFWNKRTPAGVGESVDYFERALQADPRYALAYTGLADSYLLQGSSGYSVLRPREAMAKAKESAERALAIDTTLAEAHTSLAYSKLIYDWDWPGAEREFRQALDLNPSDTTTLHWYSHYLTAMGRHDESIAVAKRALEINPVDLSLNEHLAWVYLMARQYDRAVEQCRKTLEMDSNFALAHRRLGEAYLYQGQYADAIAEFQKGLELSGGAVVYQGLLGQAYASSGRRAEARQALEDLEKLSREKYVSPAAIATIDTGLGDRNQAFHWLDRALDERCDTLAYAKVDPSFDSLRTDRRWSGLLKRLGLN